MRTEGSDPTPAAYTLADTLRDMVQAWNRFWFAPGDPTLLGLIRICVGLIGLYVHCAYTFDLSEFVGKHAWVGSDDFALIREDAPHFLRPNDWNEYGQMPQDPEEEQKNRFQPKTPEEEKAHMDYLIRWEGARRDQVYAFGYVNSSIWFVITEAPGLYVAHGCIILVFFLFTIGLATRVTSVLAWLAALSFMQRSPASLFGMDSILNFMLLYLMIGPSGAALSVDRLLERYWRSRRLLRRSRAGKDATNFERNREHLAAPHSSVSANFALRLIQIHLSIVYIASGLSKLQGQTWWQGTSIWATLANPEFSPVHMPPFTWFLEFLVNHRPLWEMFMTGGVIFTLVFEISFPFLIWNPRFRWIYLVAAVMLHTGIALCMGLNTFSLIMMTAVASFIPQQAVHKLLNKLGRGKEEFQLVYNGRERHEVRAAALVQTFDVWGQGTYTDAGSRTEPVEEHAGLHLTTDKGETFSGVSLFHRLTRTLRLLRPLALVSWLPGLPALGKALFGSAPHKHEAAVTG